VARTYSDIINAMKAFIKSVKPTLDTSEGTIINDIVINAPSQEISKIYTELDITSQSQSLLNAPDSALDGLGSNLGLIRKSARQARGYVRFFSFTAPVSDITIAAGTVVSTVPTSNNLSQRFLTTTTATMYSSLATIYLNPSTNVYEIEIPVVAVNAGLDGIVGAQTITSLITPIAGIGGCYNPDPTTGGSDEEDIEVFRSRIATKWKGSSIGTVAGLLSDVLSYSDDIIDATVIGHADVERTDAGAVDVYIKGVRDTSYQEVFTTFDNAYDELILNKQPVIDTSPISIILSETGVISSSNYTLTKDTGVYKGSVRGQDKIVWNVSIPSSSGSLTMNYSYNSLVEDLQTYLERSDKLIQNVDVLVKWANEIAIDVTTTIKILVGYDQATVITNIQNEIALFFNTLNIGQEVQQADVARIILNVTGVDDLLLPFSVFRSSDLTITPDAFNNLVIPSDSYAIAGTLTINVN
jgi:uncharacterized phage protein gp47/JayE